MNRLVASFFSGLLLTQSAWAGNGTVTVKDSTGTTQTFDVTTDGSGNFIWKHTICDQAAAASCASVGTAGSPSTNALTIQALTLGHGTAANAMRVELPTDGTGLVNVAQSGAWNITTVTTLTTLSTLTGGGVASGAADSGNPVKVGGKYNLSPIALTDGNRGDFQIGVGGAMRNSSFTTWTPTTTWTTATSGNTNLVLSCGDDSAGTLVDVLGSGTITTGVLSFQYSNDATDCSGATGTWTNFPLSNIRTQFPLAQVAANPYTIQSSDSVFLLLPSRARATRVRLTTVITGAGGQVVINGTSGATNPAENGILNATGIDQTTLGVTNGMAIVGINTATALAGNGASGTGSLRTNLANDNTGIANWGHGATAASVPPGATLAGGRAQNAEATAVTNGQLAAIALDLVGKQIVLPYANPENFLNGEITAAMTATTSTALTGMGAQGGSFRVYATSCTFSNSHATVGTMINLQDGSGGAVIWQAPAASVFGGAVVVFPTPIKTTANTGLFAVNVTTGSNTFVSCTGYKAV